MKTLQELFAEFQAQQQAQEPYQKKVWRRVHGNTQDILIDEYTDTVHRTGLIHYDCGCSRPTELIDKFVGEPFISDTQLKCCKNHFRVCDDCGRGLCIAGRPDGFRLDYEGKTYWLCQAHFITWRKDILRRNFWSGFKRGLFGRNDDE